MLLCHTFEVTLWDLKRSKQNAIEYLKRFEVTLWDLKLHFKKGDAMVKNTFEVTLWDLKLV